MLDAKNDESQFQQQNNQRDRIQTPITRQVALEFEVRGAVFFAVDQKAPERKQDARKNQKVYADGDLIDESNYSGHVGKLSSTPFRMVVRRGTIISAASKTSR